MFEKLAPHGLVPYKTTLSIKKSETLLIYDFYAFL